MGDINFLSSDKKEENKTKKKEEPIIWSKPKKGGLGDDNFSDVEDVFDNDKKTSKDSITNKDKKIEIPRAPVAGSISADLIKRKANAGYNSVYVKKEELRYQGGNFFDKLIDWWKEHKEKSEKELVEEAVMVAKQKRILSEIPKNQNINSENFVNNKKEKQAFSQNKEQSITENKVLQTNLIQGEKIFFFDWQKNSLILLSAVFFGIVIIGTIFGVLKTIEYSKIKEIKEINIKITELKKKIEVSKENSVTFFKLQTKLQHISNLLKNHIYWSPFFTLLEEYTNSDVYYTNFIGDTEGIYALPVKAKSFSSVSNQIDVFKKSNLVLNSDTDGARFNQEKGSDFKIDFILNLKINKEIFKKNAKNNSQKE